MKLRTREILLYCIEKYPVIAPCKDSILQVMDLIIECYNNKRKIMLCGNGGSACDCEHIVAELMKGYNFPRKMPKEMQNILEQQTHHAEYIIKNLEVALPAISLVSQIGLSTAFANDRRPDLNFAQQVLGYAKEGDILWVLSTSGNSKNVVYASEVAHAAGCKVIGLLGKNGGRMKNLCDEAIIVPGKDTNSIQELHLVIYHAICQALEYQFFSF